MRLDSAAQRLWYGPAWRGWWLWPLELLYRSVVAIRHLAYSTGLAQKQRVPVPVVVVGNLTVGGTGKTPVVAWLARRLRARGLRVGIVLRGYRGSHGGAVLRVLPDTDVTLAGDEAVMHANSGADIVVVAHDRVAAARAAAEAGAQIVISDDGLQHLRLARDFEIVVVDPARGFGNGHCLPAGPLREPSSRLGHADAVLLVERVSAEPVSLTTSAPSTYRATFELGDAVNLRTAERRPLSAFAGERIRAVAGVGRPDAFFAALERAGLRIDRRPLPDHVGSVELERAIAGPGTVLMTAKDAVKCRAVAGTAHWVVTLELAFAPGDDDRLIDKLLERIDRTPNTGDARG